MASKTQAEADDEARQEGLLKRLEPQRGQSLRLKLSCLWGECTNAWSNDSELGRVRNTLRRTNDDG